MQYKTNYCDICGKNKYELDTHHLINGSNRKLADQDGLTVEICRTCHSTVHNIPSVERLSKMLGQSQWEFNYLLNKFCNSEVDKAVAMTEAREMFRKRYQNCYLP